MRLSEIFGKLLGENLLTEVKHSYGCVMLFFPVTTEFWDKIQSRVDDDDLSSEKDEDGVEKMGRNEVSDAHVTLLYGIHEDVPDEDVEAIIDTIKSVDVTLKKVSTFDNEKFDVLKFDVEGDKLFEYNKDFAKLPHTNTHGEYHPHLTIAYVKKGVLTDDAKSDLSDEEALTVKANKVVYSKPDGTQKEYEL